MRRFLSMSVARYSEGAGLMMLCRFRAIVGLVKESSGDTKKVLETLLSKM